MKQYCKYTMAHLRHWFSPFTEVWVESATSFIPDYQIYYQRNIIYQVSSRKLGKIKSLFRVVEIKSFLFTWLTNRM